MFFSLPINYVKFIRRTIRVCKTKGMRVENLVKSHIGISKTFDKNELVQAMNFAIFEMTGEDLEDTNDSLKGMMYTQFVKSTEDVSERNCWATKESARLKPFSSQTNLFLREAPAASLGRPRISFGPP